MLVSFLIARARTRRASSLGWLVGVFVVGLEVFLVSDHFTRMIMAGKGVGDDECTMSKSS